MNRFRLNLMCGVVAAALVLQGPAFAAAASEPLALPQLLQEARAKNPDVLAARKRWEAAQQRIKQAKGLPAPRIGVEWEEIPKGGVKLNEAMLMYQIIQSLPFPGKLSATQQVAVKEAQVAAMEFRRAEWDVFNQLKAAYYDLYLLDREQEIAQEERLWLSQAVAAAQARYETGAAPQAELLRVQTELLDVSAQQQALRHRREALAAHINHLMSRSVSAPIGAPNPLSLTPLEFSPDELLAVAAASQPELLMFKFSAERAEAALRLAKRELLPDLETMFELRDPAMGPVGPWDLTLAFTIPFWFWTKWKYGINAALYDSESATAAYQAAQNEIARRVHEHWHEAMAAHVRAGQSRDGLLPLAEQAVASSMAAYQSGEGSSLELLEALRALSQQRRMYYEQLVAFEQHVLMLEEAVGIPLRPAHRVTAESGGIES